MLSYEDQETGLKVSAIPYKIWLNGSQYQDCLEGLGVRNKLFYTAEAMDLVRLNNNLE